MSDKITKAEMKILERMFAKEVECAMNKNNVPAIFQSKAKVMTTLEEKNLVARVSWTLGGRFPIVIKGHMLTHAGRMAYCETC